MITFDREQKNALAEGAELRKMLKQITSEACDVKSGMKYRHTFITGTPGVGKSFSVEQAVQESKVPYGIIKGQASLFGMAQNLAVLKVKHPFEPVVIIVDDCDSLFADADSINTMKDVLGPNSTFTYSKNLHLNSVPEGAKRDAVEVFMNDGATGFEIPLDNFFFVFTSNVDLPTKQRLAEALKRSKGTPSTQYYKLEHLHAIRSRVNYKSITSEKDGMWGSIAYVLLEDGACPERSVEEKMMILDWMWNKWDKMTETSVRTAEKMSEDIDKVGIEGVKDRWTYNYIA
jgi:hypothetical protein